MKKLLLLALAALCAPAAFADACLPGTLQDYIDLGAAGCQDGPVRFTAFAVEPGQSFATPISPSLVQVSPGGTPFLAQLIFTLNQTALAGELFELFFHFGASGPGLVRDALSLDGGATGDGAAIATQDICPDGSFNPNEPLGCPAAPATLITFANANDALLSDARIFPAASFFDVFADITIDGGLSGSAFVNSATVQVAVPEPATAVLLLAACVALTLRPARRGF